MIWVGSWKCGCLITRFCYHLLAKPGNKTATPPWRDPFTHRTDAWRITFTNKDSTVYPNMCEHGLCFVLFCLAHHSSISSKSFKVTSLEMGQSCNCGASKYIYLLIFFTKWVRSWRCTCLVTWFCYQMIAKPGNKTGPPSWPDPFLKEYQ